MKEIAMDFSNEVFSLKRIRELDLAFLLDMLGHEVTSRKKNDTDYWYLSPLRNERTASFHVDRSTNEWYDFGLAAGGNPIDFCLHYYRSSVAELLDRFNCSFSPHQLYLFEPDSHDGRVKDRPGLVVKSVQEIYSYPLKNYLQERSIPLTLAAAFCKEVTYEVGGRSYYGIGFQNDAGGWEIRNQNFKQSCSPKDITCLGSGTGSVHVFEGFMDLLSYKTLHPQEDTRSSDFVVLNGAGLFDRALPFLEQHERVHLWLDRDVTGMAYTKYALSLGEQFKDKSGFYEQFKDLNDWLRCKGELKNKVPQQRPGLRASG
jgi:DNA primase